MKHCIYIFLLGVVLFVSCGKTIKPEIDTVTPTGRRLRVIMEELYKDSSVIVGVTCGLWAFDYPSAAAVVDSEFSYVTPENDFKQLTIHPNNTDWNFTNATKWIQHVGIHNQILRIHCPIGPQVSDWAEDDSRTADELEKNMSDFLMAVCTTFNSHACVKYMDVVNETVQKGEWFGPKVGSGANMWENPWPKIGVATDKNNTPLYIKKAFQITNEYAPNIKQLYNHHEGPENTASWNLIKETILNLQSEGITIDAVGWQAHVDNGWTTSENLQALRDLIDWVQLHNMEFHITEASSFIKENRTEYQLQLQAETYSKILAVLLEKSTTGRVGWNTWHLTDAYTYRSEYFPSLFDENCNAKPAYYAIQKVLEDFR